MNDVGRLRHSVWECKYHLVWIPKGRRKVLYGQLRRELGEVFHELARQKECRIEEGHMLSDHVHVLMSIPPKHAVARVVGFLKGKSAIHIAPGIQWSEEKLRRATVLGTGLLRVHGGQRSRRCASTLKSRKPRTVNWTSCSWIE